MKTTPNNILKDCKEKIISFLKDPLFLSRWVDPYYSRRETNRISVAAHGSSYRWRWYPYEREIHMFVEDMHNGIMPYRLYSDQSQFEVKLDSKGDGLEALISEALHGDRYGYGLAEALSDFIRDATRDLFFYGRIAYEITYETDDDKILKFNFDSINPLSLIKFFGSYLQIIPWWVARLSRVKVGMHRILKKKMLYIEFPQKLGGRKGLKKILNRLEVLGKELIPEFSMETMKENRNIGFDLNQYTREKYLEKAQITKELGWNQRKIPDNEILEYYSMYRRLKFVLSQAIVREHILETINQCLNGPLLNLGTRILMDGIPSSKQIEAEFKALKAGNLEFTELFKRTTIE